MPGHRNLIELIGKRIGVELHHVVRILLWPFRHPHRTVKEIEPWGIFLAVIGLSVSIGAFWIDYRDRSIERRLRAWEIATSDGPYSGGKDEAVTFLLGNGRGLSGARLNGVVWADRDLTGVDLARAALIGASFEGTNAMQANLTGADLTKANLNWADLTEATLTRADLSGGELKGANLARARLSKATLSGADLSNANLSGANLSSADLSGANLGGANLVRAQLFKARLDDTAIKSARFCGTSMPDLSVCNRDCKEGNLRCPWVKQPRIR